MFIIVCWREKSFIFPLQQVFYSLCTWFGGSRLWSRLQQTQCRLGVSAPALIYVGWLSTSRNTGLAVSIPSAHMKPQSGPCEAPLLKNTSRLLVTKHDCHLQPWFQASSASTSIIIIIKKSKKSLWLFTMLVHLKSPVSAPAADVPPRPELHLSGHSNMGRANSAMCQRTWQLSSTHTLTFQSQTYIQTHTHTQTHIVAIWCLDFLSHPPSGFQTAWVKLTWWCRWNQTLSAGVDARWRAAVKASVSASIP